MKKHFLLLVFILVASYTTAQVNEKYKQGAVPEVNGKVVFAKTIKSTQNLSSSELYSKIDEWVQGNYNNPKTPENRVLLKNEEKGQIACAGEQRLVFKRAALSLDSSPMSYQLIFTVENGGVEAVIRNISYEYDSGRKNERLPAEEMITDKVAIHKNGSKLNSYYDKFRMRTIDSVLVLFESVEKQINGVAAPAPIVQTQYVYVTAPVEETSSLVAATTNANSLAGYRSITPDKIPGNIVRLLGDWTLITSGSGEEVNVMTASWGGLGVLWEKPISTCFLNPTRYSVETMDKGDTYTISFYTEAYKDAMKYCGTTSGRNTDKIKGSGLSPIKTPSGATAFSEAWMIFECRKIVAQPISADAVTIKSELKDDWTKNGFHKMYIGEILNVWVK